MNLSQALKGLPHEDVAQGRPLDGQLSLPSCVDPRPGGTTEVSGRAPGPSPQAAETRTYPGADGDSAACQDCQAGSYTSTGGR